MNLLKMCLIIHCRYEKIKLIFSWYAFMSDIIEEKIEGIKNVKIVKDDNGKLWVRQVSNINI